jgi:hypothetical protein
MQLIKRGRERNRPCLFLVPLTGDLTRFASRRGQPPRELPEAWGNLSPISPCSIPIRQQNKKKDRKNRSFLFLVPLTGIEPVRELPPEGF